MFICKESVTLTRKPPDHKQLGTAKRRTQRSCSFSCLGQWNGKQQFGTAVRKVAWAPGSLCEKSTKKAKQFMTKWKLAQYMDSKTNCYFKKMKG